MKFSATECLQNPINERMKSMCAQFSLSTNAVVHLQLKTEVGASCGKGCFSSAGTETVVKVDGKVNGNNYCAILEEHTKYLSVAFTFQQDN